MSDFGALVQEYYVRKFRVGLEKRRRRLAELADDDDARALVRATRAKIAGILPLPRERCPLAPVLAGRIERAEFSIEKIIYHSRPDFPVSANLYLPARTAGPRPGILFLCGHSLEGKAAPNYQAVAQSLARKGCVTLVIDPLGQGERRQFPDHPAIGNCREHNVFNRRMLAYGEHFGIWRVFDAVRGIDYLLSRPEVDPARVGVTGNSGGGTLASLVTAIDGRISASAPGCYITRFLSNVENELPADAEQIPPGLAADGGDMIDLLLAAAPRPILVLAQKNDFFDARGAVDAVKDLNRVYSLLGCSDDVGLFVGPDDHGYFAENRRAAYAFFIKRFRLDADPREDEIEYFSEADLHVAPTGRVVDLPGTKRLHELVRDRVRRTVAARPKRSSEELARLLRERLGLLPDDGRRVVHYRQLRPATLADGARVSRYGLETEPGIVATLSLSAGKDVYFHLPAFGRTELYLPHQDAKAELLGRPTGHEPVFGLDYRGVGENMPIGYGLSADRDFFDSYHCDYHYASLALLLGESLLGQRVRDVLAALALLRAHGNGDLVLTARGIGRVPAVLAAFLTPDPVVLRLDAPLETNAEDALTNFGHWPQSVILPGILALTDYDELQALIAERTAGLYLPSGS